MTTPVILDCDTGTDDAVAIMAAALHPALNLLGVTTVWGNHDVRHTTDNTLRVLDHIGRGDVPVHAGRNEPFRPRESPLPSGRDDLPSTLDLPAPQGAAGSSDAVGWLVETLRATPEPVTLVPTGPLTNVAAAVELAPDIVGAVRRVVALAGTHVAPGVRPLVERNVWCDPEAAAYVVAAGFADLTFVGMDATFAAALDAADADRLAALATPAGEAAGGFQRQRIELYGGESAPLHDPLAVAALLDEGVVRTEPATVTVELDPGPTYGRTTYGLGAEQPTLRVALDADRSRFLAFLCEALG
ncbi:MAG TPA: nucleoside hydrolase [Nocardioides sp.]|nr:nucleoside hydrolase [Nocardioides sp.]